MDLQKFRKTCENIYMLFLYKWTFQVFKFLHKKYNLSNIFNLKKSTNTNKG